MRKKMVSGIIILSILSTMITSVFAHPGRTDKYGGHYCRKSGWGWTVGKYHYHKGAYAGYEVDYAGQVPKKVKYKKAS